MWWRDKQYVSVAQRKAMAAKEAAKRSKRGGSALRPVRIEGRAIAKTVWGKAWCEHLETCHEFASRVERGRTYVRNGSVIDLQTSPGRIEATVVGSSVYRLEVAVAKLPAAAWAKVKAACAGRIASAVELLQGRVSQEVMTAVAAQKGGLMPRMADLTLRCSCPDGAYVCKHLAAALYGVGARLDAQPELLFALRGVDHLELIDAAVAVVPKAAKPGRRTVAASDLADVFGIELGGSPAAAAPEPAAAPAATGTKKKAPAKPARAARAPAAKTAPAIKPAATKRQAAAAAAPVRTAPAPKPKAPAKPRRSGA